MNYIIRLYDSEKIEWIEYSNVSLRILKTTTNMKEAMFFKTKMDVDYLIRLLRKAYPKTIFMRELLG